MGLINDQLHVKPFCRNHTEKREGLPVGESLFYAAREVLCECKRP